MPTVYPWHGLGQCHSMPTLLRDHAWDVALHTGGDRTRGILQNTLFTIFFIDGWKHKG